MRPDGVVFNSPYLFGFLMKLGQKTLTVLSLAVSADAMSFPLT